MVVRIGVISVGGHSSRFAGGALQKCLLPVDGKSLLDYSRTVFEELGFELVIYLTGHFHEQVDSYLSKASSEGGPAIARVYGDKRGEMFAILQLKSFLREDFIYAAGDCIVDPRLIKDLIVCAEKYENAPAILSGSRLIEGAPEHARISLQKNRFVSSVTQSNDPHAPKVVATGAVYFRQTAFHLIGQMRFDTRRYVGELVRVCKKESIEIPISISRYPWFCIHTPADLDRWQHSKMKSSLGV